jgi:cytoskeleton protein RodZ
VNGGAATAVAPDATQPAAESVGLRIRAVQSSWVQVHDARGQPLLSRLVTAGEVIDLDGRRPLKVRVGNVSGTEVQWRGRRLDLDTVQRNNVAQLDLE